MRATWLLLLLVAFCSSCSFGFVSKSDGAVPPPYPWWKKTIIYQIYPRSFKDSDGDGIGDLPGIISELEHFVDIGVETIWLSPFYKSPQVDFGYDISNQRDVDPMFGKISDFKKLVKKAKSLGLRVLVDFVPNHVSDQHYWFKQSVLRQGKYTDFFVWHDGKLLSNGTRVPPNNWIGVFGKSAWTWHNVRRQYYLHQFTPQQCDLNFRNPDVREEILLAMRYWLDFGIDGLRMDAIAQMYESVDLTKNEPRSGNPNVRPDEYEYLNHTLTNFLPGVRDEIIRWQGLVDGMKKVDGKERFIVLEYYTDSKTRGEMAEYGAHPFNMDMVEQVKVPTSGKQIMSLIAQEYKDKPASYWPTFVISNHDRHRGASKYGTRYVNAFNMLLMTLKGTPTTYYGEEIGMEDIVTTYNQSKDPWAINAGPNKYLQVSRDLNRSPMQWDNSSNAGFTTGVPWLPVHPNYKIVNVKSEKADRNSPMQLYREFADLRKLQGFAYGDIDVNVVTNENVLSFTRTFGNDKYLVAINFGQANSTDDYSGAPVNSNRGIVLSNTGNVPASISKSVDLNLQSVTLRPGDGIVVKY